MAKTGGHFEVAALGARGVPCEQAAPMARFDDTMVDLSRRARQDEVHIVEVGLFKRGGDSLPLTSARGRHVGRDPPEARAALEQGSGPTSTDRARPDDDHAATRDAELDRKGRHSGGQMTDVTNSVRAPLTLEVGAPTLVFLTSPPLKTISAGMLRMPYLMDV